MEQATTLIGDKAVPTISDELMMMRFITEKGTQGRSAFEQYPLYFGENTW